MPDRIRLDGRVAVVTGAAGVIGTAAMRLLAERGARIVAVDRNENAAQNRDQGFAGLGAGAGHHRRCH
jgi:NAD(P)-dependent dehydrogenase (short-subunit alcohol dehydrogenase family)